MSDTVIEEIKFIRDGHEFTVRMEWTNHIGEISMSLFAFIGGQAETYKLFHAKSLPNVMAGMVSANIRVVDTRWFWWRLYWSYDYLSLQLFTLKIAVYRWLWNNNRLATQEGNIPSWRDIRLFGIKKE